ncbi:MAG: SDR family NAD(P)-dependent oxidoreductase [Comamonadaceae bacterium]|nr:MAG: SDR family NAD(P)-dependent oxidoreductase [Comamonadaceae bacterium]
MVCMKDQVVVVTGATGGLGREWVRQSLDRGAVRVYAADLTQGDWNDRQVVPLAVDLTREQTVVAAAAVATDATILINNAGIPLRDPILSASASALRNVFDVNFFGTLGVTRAFAPIVIGNGGGAILNVVSLLSWLSIAPGYSASKAALWSATNALRLELAPEGVEVVSLHMGYTATPMTRSLDVPKNDPADVVRAGLDGLEAGALEVLADEWSACVKAALAGPVEGMYPQLSGGLLPFGQDGPSARLARK